jgi:pimeloyl-ACP methyl ester carboxylesterase
MSGATLIAERLPLDRRLECVHKPSQGGTLFVLVHGTWARGASWTKEKGRLPQALLQEWPDAGIFAFGWQGFNRLTARLRASEQLATAIRSLRTSYPLSRVVVIAHSHGGNIAAWATTATPDVDTVVYLNTPFLRVVRAHLPALATICAFGVPAPFNRIDPIRFLLQVVLGLMVMVVGVPLLLLGQSLGPIANLTSFTIVVALSYLMLRGSFHLTGRIRTAQSDLVRLTEANRLVRRELVVGATGDEALTGLTTANAAIAVLGSFTRRPLRSLTAATQYLADDVGPFALLFAVFLLIVMVPFGVMIGVAMIAYGPVQGLMAAEVTLATTAAPNGVTEVLSVDVQTSRGLKHSLVYDEPKILEKVVRWLRLTQDQRPVDPPTT